MKNGETAPAMMGAKERSSLAFEMAPTERLTHWRNVLWPHISWL